MNWATSPSNQPKQDTSSKYSYPISDTCKPTVSSTTSLRIHRGSYRSAHVLLNLLNLLGKKDKMRGLPSILSLFRNKLNIYSIIQEHAC